MRTALYQLGEDFLSTIVFLIVYFISGELYLAIAVAMAVGVGSLCCSSSADATRTSWGGSAW